MIVSDAIFIGAGKLVLDTTSSDRLVFSTLPLMLSEDLVDMQLPNWLEAQSLVNEFHLVRWKNSESVLI